MTQKQNSHIGSLGIISSLFFFFGFLTCMNDILVPHLKAMFTLNYTQATLIQFAFFSSYFVVSIPSSKFCEKVGYQAGTVVGLIITALGACGFLGSAHYHSFPLFLGSFFILAAGITLIQVAANPYVTLLGKPETSSMRLTLVQAFNSLGTTIAPLFGAAVILSNQSAGSIEKPYIVIAGLLFLLAAFVYFSKLPKVTTTQEEDAPWSELFANRRLMMGALGIFMYVGAEVAIGTLLISWLGDSHVASMPAETAGNYVAFYWGGAMVGRFLGTPLLMKYKAPAVLKLFVTGAIVMTLISVFGSGSISQWSILSVGLFNSIMFPTIFSQSISGLKRGVEKASGLLCTAIVGGAIIPLFQGMIADGYALRWSFLLPVACYGYLWYFAHSLKAAEVTTPSETTGKKSKITTATAAEAVSG